MADTLIAENPKVDVDGVIRVGDGGNVIGYTFAEDKRTSIYTDPQFSGLAKSLSKALPKLPLVNLLDATPDGQKLLIFAGSDSDPGAITCSTAPRRRLPRRCTRGRRSADARLPR
jgi:hypothetical protein